MFSRKDYVLAAKEIQDIPDLYTRIQVYKNVVGVFKSSNNFDEGKFWCACNVPYVEDFDLIGWE